MMIKFISIVTFLNLMVMASVATAQGLSQGQDGLPDKPQDASPYQYVELRALDKITARITVLRAKINQETRFGTLAIRPKYCRTRPPEEQPETYAYLEIFDLKHDQTRSKVFSGWMMASNPALNALEHPVYDVWVINCKISDGDASVDKE